MYNGLLEHYDRKGQIAEYYTMDYQFAIEMQKSPLIRGIIAAVPEINANLFGSLMHKTYDKTEYDLFLAPALFFKLNHRTEYQTHDDKGNGTVFGHMSRSI